MSRNDKLEVMTKGFLFGTILNAPFAIFALDWSFGQWLMVTGILWMLWISFVFFAMDWDAYGK